MAIEQDKTPPSQVGVRHVLRASMSVGETTPYAKAKANDAKLEGHLRVSVRISDHSSEADFFGVITADFANTDLLQPAPEKTIWQAGKCHRDRGWPKVTVIGIEGEIFDGQINAKVTAVPRHIGKLMPADEIIVTKRLPSTSGSLINEWAIRAQAKASRVIFDLRLTALRCDM